MINQIEPWITEAEISEVFNCISSTFVTEGKYTSMFEQEVAKLHGCTHQPVAYANATAGLYASLKLLGIKPGQEVIIPALTFIATANSIIMAGGIPVCADIDLSFNLDLEHVEQLINANTFAIMPVHLYGHFTNVTQIKRLCEHKGLKLIEDASQGVGVCDTNNNFAGTLGDFGVLSFYGNKFVTAAQGGMILSNSKESLEAASKFKNHGRSQKGTFFHESVGFNFCTSDLHSALGYSQMLRFEEIRTRKLQIFKRYKANLSQIDGLEIDEIDSKKPSYWFISIFCKNASELERKLKVSGVQTRRSFPPLSLQPCYNDTELLRSDYAEGATKIFERYLSLPSSATLSDSQIDNICEIMIEALK